MKRISSIIMELGLGLPTGTIAFWGSLVPRILTVDYSFKSTLIGRLISIFSYSRWRPRLLPVYGQI